ncbi:MAG: hypothetical protein PHD25_05700 [Bacteroidales bacterium]|nr:hypothetical protein [Bacteroidales bacterium]
MKGYLILFYCTLVSLTGFADGWELVKDKNGLKIYLRPTEGSPYKTYKGEAVLTIKMEDLYKVLIDVGNYSKWVYECSESRLLSKVDNSEYTYYSLMHLPFPFDNRDMTTTMKVSFSSDTIYLATKLKKTGQVQPRGLVAIAAYDELTTLIRIDDRHVRMIMEGYFEPGGSLPAWLMNMFLSEGPYESIMKIKELFEP